jgi:hypothetical protein
MAVDLHIHTTASDGTLTPAEVVARAAELGMAAIGITDHDSVAGVAPAMEAARGTGMHVLGGVEMSVDFRQSEIHVLGYFVDIGHEPLLEATAKIRASRLDRAAEMVRRLAGLGIPITMEHVEAEAGQGSVGRPHVANALVKVGAVKTAHEAFERYLVRGQPGYVPRYKLEPGESVKLIADAGGMPVMSHPGLCRCDDMIDALRPEGLLGIEAYHVEHSPAQARKYVKMARSRGMYITGGSDSHGPRGPVPVEIGSVYVPDECAEKLMEWADEHGRPYV